MKIEIKRDAVLIIPENEHYRAYIEDSLGLKKTGDEILIKRIDNVQLGYCKTDEFCLKAGPKS